MTVTSYSCICSVVISTVFLSCLCFIRSKYHFTKVSEVKAFIFLYVLIFIRFFFPLDFNFTLGIPLEGVYSDFFEIFFIKQIQILDWQLPLMGIILLILFSISAIKIFIYIRNYARTSKEIRTFKPFNSQQIQLAENNIKKLYPNLPSYTVLKCEYVNTPLAIGIFHKKIILPAEEYSDTELYYILLHEYTHLAKNDLLKKYMIDIICALFWWIPFTKFIGKDVEQIIEIACDYSIVNKISTREKISYLDTLMDVVKRTSKHNSSPLQNSLAFAVKENPHSMVERFRLIEEKPKKKTRIKGLFLKMTAIMLIACSYLAVPMPSYEAPIEEIETNGCKSISPDSDSYICIKGNSYFLVIENKIVNPISTELAGMMIDSGIKFKKENK